jgi:phosphoenolpyruvate-protein phosphotransferase
MPLEIPFEWPLTNGLHARPASHLAELANRFESQCALINQRSGAEANARSVLSLVAADVRLGDRCGIRISGSDEAAAGAALRQFVTHELPAIDGPLAIDEPLAAPGAFGSTLPRALRDLGLPWYPGTPVSRGIGRGKVVKTEALALPPELDAEPAGEPAWEQERIEKALDAVRDRIKEVLHRGVSPIISPTGAAILQAHLAIATDPTLAEKLAELVSCGAAAGRAVAEAGEFFAARLREAGSQYIRERAIDVQDICIQLLEAIYGPDFQPAAVPLTEAAVVVAESMAPRQFLALDRRWLQALVLGSAGATSHTVILARSLGVPVLAGVTGATLSAGQEVVVDANCGLLIAQCSEPVSRFYEREEALLRRRQEILSRGALALAATADGRRLEVAANISSAAEALPAFENGADGIGVFRTEMLFVGRESSPCEEEQFAIYAAAARGAAGRPVIIRTLDVGGDKPLAYLNLPREANPFLGYRGVRIYAQYAGLLRTQLRAAIRASACGRIWVMAPMISCVSEAREFRACVARAQEELKAEGAAFDRAMPVGIMVEVPAVAFMIGPLCREADFFSIGTNDLAQYFFAADRDNPTVSAIANVRHPSFLRLLRQIVEAVHGGGRWVGLCGEMGGDARNLPLLVGLGLDEISGAGSAIPALKDALRRLRVPECRDLLARAEAAIDSGDVERMLEQARQRRPLADADLVLLDSAAATKADAIREMVEAFYVAGRTESPERLEEAVWAREAVYSTGLGHGFAIPHCKTDAVTDDSIAVLRLRQPVEWGSLDGAPVRMAILLATRQSAGGGHMQVFSRLARRLMHQPFREGLLAAQDPAGLLDLLLTPDEPSRTAN